MSIKRYGITLLNNGEEVPPVTSKEGKEKNQAMTSLTRRGLLRVTLSVAVSGALPLRGQAQSFAAVEGFQKMALNNKFDMADLPRALSGLNDVYWKHQLDGIDQHDVRFILGSHTFTWLVGFITLDSGRAWLTYNTLKSYIPKNPFLYRAVIEHGFARIYIPQHQFNSSVRGPGVDIGLYNADSTPRGPALSMRGNESLWAVFARDGFKIPEELQHLFPAAPPAPR